MSTDYLEHNAAQSARLLNVHSRKLCDGQVCCIHNRSAHTMRRFKQIWRDDRSLMERVCPHGVGHPDPDHLAYIASLRGSEYAQEEAIHGCDGCCAGAYA